MKGFWDKDTLAFNDDDAATFTFGIIDNPHQFKMVNLGLSNSRHDYVPIPHQLKNAGITDHAVASFYYRGDRDQGKLIFGGYDQAKVGSEWSVHANDSGFNVTVNGKTTYPEHGDFLLRHVEGTKRCNFNGNVAEKHNNITSIGGAILNKPVSVFDYENDGIKVALLKDTDDEDIVKA